LIPTLGGANPVTSETSKTDAERDDAAPRPSPSPEVPDTRTWLPQSEPLPRPPARNIQTESTWVPRPPDLPPGVVSNAVVMEEAARIAARATGRAAGAGAAISTSRDDKVARRIERTLSERPVDYRDMARALCAAVRDQLAELQRQKPNEEDRLPSYNELVGFLEKLENDLAALAEALNQATSKSGTVEPIFLGRAAEIARQLELGFTGWLEKNRERVFEVGFNFVVWGSIGYFIGGFGGAAEHLKAILGK
jgi:hypothetical protein